MPRKSEDEGFVEIGRVHVVTMQHVDEGETETVTKVGVNEEPTFRSAEMSQKVAGVTVKILEKMDNTVRTSDGGAGIKFASKKYRQIQEKEGGAPVSTTVGEPHTVYTPAPTEEKPSILKNFVDKLADRMNIELPQLHKWDKVTIGVAAFGVAMAIAALAIGLSKL